jgi:hypothetical protein
VEDGELMAQDKDLQILGGVTAGELEVLDQAREDAFFVEKYPRCVTAVVAAQR